MSKLRVLILGCGPAGLLAAHAARLHDAQVIIVSVKRPSQLYGCQYLHQAIQGLECGQPQKVRYMLNGTVEGYAEKVYGPHRDRDMKVSPETFGADHFAWDIRSAYQQLWDHYEWLISDVRLNSNDIEGMLGFYQPTHTFSTLPLPLICADPAHDFRSTKCYAIGDAPELGQHAPRLAPEFTVMCDGTEYAGFYRAANVFGYSTVEWPGWRSKPPVDGVVDFLKPVSNTCTCWPEVRRVGRMGQWQKGVLAHHAFNDVMAALGSR